MGLPPAQKSSWKGHAGRSLARLIRMVIGTSQIVMEPADLKQRLRAEHPIILAAWHGQFMMLVHLNPADVKVSAMVARHGDAELIGEAMAAFGVELIRGAGAGERRKDRGGAHALRAAVAALTGAGGNAPSSLVMTADVPPGPARRAGEGIIAIARLSGCAIVPVAAASSRYKSFRTWSRMTVNLPWSKLAFVGGGPIHVPREATPEQAEQARLELETALNAVTARAYQLAGADPARATPPGAASVARRPGVLLKTYMAGFSSLRPIVGPFLRRRVRAGKEDAARLGERRGIASIVRPPGPLVWVHAASVGETNAILPLISALMAARPDLAVLLTTTTLTSATVARRRLPAGALHQFVPLDAPEYGARFLDHWRPDLAIFTESEIWPGLILATAARHIPLVLANARMSPRSYKSWKRAPSMSEPLFGRFDVILAQNEKLARWFRDVGGRSVIPVGNLKADSPSPPVDRIKLEYLSSALAGRPRLLAASTHEGEDIIIAAAHRLLAADKPGYCTIIAPRHPERGGAIAQALIDQGFTVARRSLDEPLLASTEIYIADTIGELGTLYALCPIAFVGGTLVSRGGQNPLEAVALGAVVLAGPSTHNFRDEYAALAAAGGAIEIATAADLAARVAELEADPAVRAAVAAKATAAVIRMQGALERTLHLVLPLLPPTATPVGDKSLMHAS